MTLIRLNKKTIKQHISRPSLFREGTGVSHFHRFSRKGYAIFASLHRQVRIGVLTVAMLASVNIPKVQALQVNTTPVADGEADEKELSEVAVTGTMSPLTVLQSARIVSIITAQQVEASAAQSVSDLLKLAVGVDVRQRGGFGIQSDISIDGCTFDQITLLLNGVNITSPHTGHLAADFPFGLADIERIEVLEGAASRVYGASAFGGAINIVTKKTNQVPVPFPTSFTAGGQSPYKGSHHFSIEAGLQGGSYATFGGDARVSYSKRSDLSLEGERGGGTLSGGFLRSDGATVNSDFSRGNVYHSGYYDNDYFAVEWQAGYSQKAYGANTFYSAAYPDQYEQNRRFIMSLGAESKGRVRVRPEVYWHRLVDHFQLIRGTATGENFHRSDVHGARVTADLRWAAGRTALGGEVREEGIYSTTLGRPLMNPQVHRVPHKDLYYTCHDSRTNLSINAEHNVVLSHFTASIGVLANKNTRFDNYLRLYPGIDLAYAPQLNGKRNSHLRLFASYNKGFRLPTFTDLYYKSPTHEGNQGMRAEESHSFQVGLKANLGSSLSPRRGWEGTFTFKAFYHRGSNLIDWVMYASDDVFHSANFDLDNMGFQTTLNAQYSTLNLRCSYAFIHQHRRDITEVYKSNYAMEYLRHKVVATLDHRIYSHLTASWALRWQDRMGHYLLYRDGQSTGQLVPYDPYATLDLKLRWTKPRYELWVEGTNLTNRHYYDLGNVPQPGIVVLAGLRYLLR